MNGRLEGRVVLVTGASRGIGRAIALECANQGAAVVLAATNAKRLNHVAAEVCEFGGDARVCVTNVAERDQCRAAVRCAYEEFGRLDSLVTCASIYHAAPFLECTPADYQRLLDVNLLGTLHVMQAALPIMLERGYGRIVVIASTAGRSPSRNRSAYNVSKHALIGLMRCVALETADRGVTVNAICPGPVETDMLEELIAARAKIDNLRQDTVRAAMVSNVAMKRFLKPEEIASLAVYLASEESGAMTGQAVVVDGGILFA